MVEELEKALVENAEQLKAETNLVRVIELMSARIEILKSLLNLRNKRKEAA